MLLPKVSKSTDTVIQEGKHTMPATEWITKYESMEEGLVCKTGLGA